MKSEDLAQADNLSASSFSAGILKILFDEYPFPAFCIDPETMTIIDINNSALQLLNSKKSGLLKKNLKEIYPQKRYKLIRSKISVLDEPENNEGFNSSDGISVSAGGTNGNSFILLIDKKLNEYSEGSLTKTQSLYSAIIENARDAIYMQDLECKIISWNKGAENIYGYSADEILGKNSSLLIPPQRSGEPEDLISNLRKGAKIENFETTRLRKDGKEIDISISVSPILINGEIIGASFIARDITEKKIIEVLLKEKENRFKQIAENIKEVFYIRNIESTQLQYVSPAYNELWGKSPESLYEMPSSFIEAVDSDYRHLLQQAIEKQTMGENTEVEYTITRPDGTKRWIKDRAFPVKDEYGSYYRIIGLAEDITKQKESELEKSRLLKALGEQSIRMDNIISTVPGVVWEAWREPDANSQKINFVSDYIEQMLGYSVHEWLSTPDFWLNIVHSDDKENVSKTYSQLLKSKNVGVNRFRWIAKDGRVLWIESRSTVITDDSGNPVGMRGVSIDISETKKIEEALINKEKQHSQLLSLMPAAVYTCDAEGHITYFNRRAAELWGREPKLYDPDYKFCGSFKLFNTDGSILPHHLTPMARVLKEGIPLKDLEVTIEREDSSRILVRVNIEPITDSRGEITGAINVFQDITEQKKIDYTSRYLAAIVESSSDAIISKDLNGVVTSWNKGAEKIFGYKPEEVIGKSITILIPEDRHNEEPIILDRIRRGERIEHYETIRQRKDGTLINISLTVSPIKNSEGRVIGASKIARDVTSKKKIENEVKHLAAIVEFSDDAITSEDLNGTIRSWNKGAELMYGYTSEEAVGKPVSIIIPQDRHDENKLILDQIRQGESIEHFETIRLKKDGTYIHISLTVSPIKDLSGKIIGASKIARNISDRINTEQLIKKDNKFINIANSSPAFLWINNSEGCEFVNKAYSDFCGCKMEDITGMGWAKLIHPDDYDGYVNAYLQAVSRREPFNAETRFLRKDGEWRWILSQGLPYYKADGEFYGYVGSSVDITELKLIEQELRESETKFRIMADNIAQFAWMADTSGWIFWYNQRWFDYTGTTLEEMQGWGWQNVHHPDHVERVTEKFKYHIEHGLAWEDTFPLKSKEGEFKWFLSRAMPIKGADGKIIRWFGTNTEITELKKNQIQLSFLSDVSKILASSLDYYETLSSVANLSVPYLADWCAIDILTEDQRMERVAVVHSDPAKVELAYDLNKIFPYDPEQKTGVANVIRTKKSELISEINPDLLREQIKDEYLLKTIIQLGLTSSIVVPLTAGEKILGAITLVYAESGRRYNDNDLVLAEELARRSAIAIENARLFNSTQRLNNELDKRVKIRTAQLEAANQELETFSYSVSHDLRAPLRHISGYIELLKEKANFPAEDESSYYLKKITGSAKKMGSLIDDMLAYSRIGRTELEIVRINMQELVNEVVKGFQEQLDDRTVSWSIGELPFIFGDRSMMRLVMVNLISNAVKFTGKNPKPEIEITCESSKDEFIFCIKDNGVGFDMKYVNKLFNIFQRLHSIEEFDGDGIGLANVSRIIERHGGRTWAEGEVDKGASFYFSLPEYLNEIS